MDNTPGIIRSIHVITPLSTRGAHGLHGPPPPLLIHAVLEPNNVYWNAGSNLQSKWTAFSSHEHRSERTSVFCPVQLWLAHVSNPVQLALRASRNLPAITVEESKRGHARGCSPGEMQTPHSACSGTKREWRCAVPEQSTLYLYRVRTRLFFLSNGLRSRLPGISSINRLATKAANFLQSSPWAIFILPALLNRARLDTAKTELEMVTAA